MRRWTVLALASTLLVAAFVAMPTKAAKQGDEDARVLTTGKLHEPLPDLRNQSPATRDDQRTTRRPYFRLRRRRIRRRALRASIAPAHKHQRTDQRPTRHSPMQPCCHVPPSYSVFACNES